MSKTLQSALSKIPEPIKKALEEEFVDLEARFARGDWDPAELNGGRLAEALLRYLEWKECGSYTEIGKKLNRSKIVNKVKNKPNVPDGLRFHVLSCAELLLDVRNKRDVAHLGDVIDVSEMDAHLVMRLAAWALSEVVREESGLPPHKIQKLIDQLSARRLALVEEINGRVRVVATDLQARDRALVALYYIFPAPMSIRELRGAVRYGGTFRRDVLSKLDHQALVHIEDGNVVLTRKGAAWVDKHIDMRLSV